MALKSGNLSINSENIFPIIKKWMYSDHDIFAREMISNCTDAITKLKKLDMIGEYECPDDYKPTIEVVVDPKERTLAFIDNGLGMTEDEVEEYITQIAFSGAAEFLEKYKDKTTDDQMIGHFGLGFYSAFMVADEVQIETLSFREGAKPVHWESSGETTYQIGGGSRETVGTTITLFLNDDSVEFANEYRMREVLNKYCSFMPYPIYLRQANVAQEYETIDEADLRDDDVIIERIHEEAKFEEKEKEDGTKETVEVSPAKDKVKINKRPVPLNDTTPLWSKHPNECEKDEYLEFYRKVFLDYKEPLFWIHLNMDYPFNLKGILYFPKINTEYDSIEGVIKLYNNQVFIADNIPEVVPDFLKLLKGVIDCPDLPLNVSRSALQNDGFVNKISDYITKKIADKLTGMCKTDRETYEKHWDDIAPFIKYGCLRDNKFCERLQDYILFKDLDYKYLTLNEYLEKNGLAEKEAEGDDTGEDAAAADTPANEPAQEDTGADRLEDKKNVYYITDPVQQSQYINLFKSEGLDAVYLTHAIDTPFISQLEQKNENLAFLRIDADVNESLKDDEADKVSEKEETAISDIFKKAIGKNNLLLKVEQLKDDSIASILVTSEEGRRMQDMMRMYGLDTSSPDMVDNDATLVVNANHPLVQYVREHKRSKNSEVICRQLYDMARIANHPLPPVEMTAFVQRTNDIMMLLTGQKKKSDAI